MQDKTVEMHMQCSMDCLALFGVASLRFFVDNVAFLVWFFIVLDETKRVCCVLCVSVCVCVCVCARRVVSLCCRVVCSWRSSWSCGEKKLWKKEKIKKAPRRRDFVAVMLRLLACFRLC